MCRKISVISAVGNFISLTNRCIQWHSIDTSLHAMLFYHLSVIMLLCCYPNCWHATRKLS